MPIEFGSESPSPSEGAKGLVRQLSAGYERAAEEEEASLLLAMRLQTEEEAGWLSGDGGGGGGMAVSAEEVRLQRERDEHEATAHMLIEAMGGDATQCPACGIVISKADGDDTVMCGCEARPAGGTIEKALLGGGCGHEFKYSTGEPLGQGKPGEPFNERQWKFTPRDL
jgi:hypothetical protein